jgi:N-acetyl-1-D-myo-inositol-2-amino-2-deoxy-alpha-D-glucopyranoside deacetylase
MMNIYHGKRLLAVLAHPDDETFGTGGTLALYASRGVEVHLVCATRGEVGEVDARFMKGFKTVGDLRSHELRCAAKVLGLSEVRFLGYRDSGMPGSRDNHQPRALAAQPIEKVAAEVAGVMRELRPSVVITFDPIGGYRHPDHIAIHRATVLACQLAAQPIASGIAGAVFHPEKLYFNTFPRAFMRFMLHFYKLLGRDPSKWGRNGDIDMASIAAMTFPIDARINFRPVAGVRDRASACHASQGGGMSTGIMAAWRKVFASYETFMRAYPQKRGFQVEKDLFEGIL